MYFLCEIWNFEEANFKALNMLAREFGLNQDKFKRFSLMADHISEQYAHLLIQELEMIVAGDWIGAFNNAKTPRPTFLFQTI